MVSSSKMTPWLMAFFCLATAGCTNVTDQQTSETHHDQQVAILKQIRKVNEDGSYTYGYEAGDGSFKVESRDVLGNIKGTFGFVDANGEIKRVSYSSSNGTGFKATTVSPLQEQISVVQSIPRLNRTSTTKKPSVVYATSTEASTRASVVQSIPRTRKTTTTSTTTTTTTTSEPPKTVFSHYLKGSTKSRPRLVINGQQRPLVFEETLEDEDSQINRPSTEDKSSPYRRIIFAKRPVDQNLRPITEDFVEKDDDPKITTGNALRRQLHEETTKANPVVDPDSDDHPDVYGGALSTSRPLFTTTTPTRVLQRVTGSRVERPKIFVNRENLGPARFDNTKYENPRAFETETKPTQEERITTPILIRGPPRVTPDPREYVRQSTEPVFIRQQPDQYMRELPPGRILVPTQPNNVEEDPAYRSIPIGRILYRPVPNQQPLYSTTTDANIHYLTENPVQAQEEDPRITIPPPAYPRPRPYPQPMVYPEPEARPRPILRPVTPPMNHAVNDREYQSTTPEYPYRSTTIALPPEPPNPIAPPLSRRDFQMLLKRLLVSQYGVQALNYPKTYLEDALYDQQPYPSYQPSYQTQVPRSEIPYDQQLAVQYGDRVPVRRPVYARALNPVYQHPYEDYADGRYPKRVYRQKFYAQEVSDEGDEILPGPIREALLLRMLQLAINAERPPMVPNSVITTTTAASRYRKTGPVRSVQIITDDDEEKEMMRKKI